MDLNTLISQYGYAALVIGSLAEGETVTLLGGVAAHQGLLKFPLVVLSVATRCFICAGGGLAASCYAVSRNIRIKLSGRRNLSNTIRICLSLVRALCMAFG